MIIIDEEASSKLIQALKSLPQLEGMYCLRLYPLPGAREQLQPMIIAKAQEYMSGSTLYWCDDGEVLLLAQATSKACRRTLLDIADKVNIQPAERMGEVYDLGLQNGALLALLEKKAEARLKQEQEMARQHARVQLESQQLRKRQAILDQTVQRNSEEIAAQRKLRSEPVLMIIEDDPFSRRLVENVLQKQYRMTGLGTAENALSTYANLAPDLVFLDINLPDVSGHELLERIITLDPDAYVVMLSGNADKHNVMQAMQRGAVGFVAKPFSRERLFQYIERCPTISKERVQ